MDEAEVDRSLRALILDATGARRLVGTRMVQRLWSGYGRILRCRLEGGAHDSVVVKHVRWPDQVEHPRGWSTSRSHERKVRSYEAETTWYARWAQRCSGACRVPRCLSHTARGSEVFIVLEDLDAAGFGGRRQDASRAEIESCLSWLAHFHATFMGCAPEGLWPTGTYWHLATRPDELAALREGPLKDAAPVLDARLRDTSFTTLVHGDAKLANFCFGEDGVAAVDFQYVGGGCGMKDVAYFISSCLDEDAAERLEQPLLDVYFAQLRRALSQRGSPIDLSALTDDWRALYPVAWTDFYRFLQGWSPGHWKIHRYSERLAREVLEAL